MFPYSMITMPLFAVVVLLHSHEQVHSQIQLADFNQQFRSAYREARASLLSTIDPLMITNNGNVILIHRGKRTTAQFTPAFYHDLKAISHIPLTIYLLLFNVQSNDYDLSLNQTMQLKSYLQDISTIRQSLNFTPSSESVMRTQFNIIDLSIDYLRFTLDSKQVNQTTLKEFCFEARIMFAANFDRAVRSQLDLLHSIVYPWYTQLFNETERQTLQVLLLGPKAARDGWVDKVYFYELLGERYEGKRILYAESVTDEERAMTILGSWLLDTNVGEIFYDEPSRLHRDLLANEAAIYVKKLFKQTDN